jgi:hypothetical protein
VLTGPIRSLVLARVRRRGLTTGLSIGAVAAAVALVAVVAGIGAVATDRTLARAVAAGGADRPLVRVSHFSSSGRDWAAVSERADRVLASLGAHTDAPVRGVLIRELTDLDAPIFELIVAVDDPARWASVIDGRLPAPCTRARCEALLASETPPPAGFTAARPTSTLTLPIVGRGLLDAAVPFERLDQGGPAGERPANDSQTERRAPAILLVNGVDAIALEPSLERTNRTYVWTAPLRRDAIHPWTVDDFEATVSSVTRRLAEDDSAFTVSSPVGRIGDELARAEAARGRLLLIGSLAVAILLAFAVFAALVGKADLAAEIARLNAIGARRRDVAGFVALEALLPVAIGALFGAGAGTVVVAALAASQGAPVGSLLAEALLAPGTLLAAAVTLVLAVLATLAVTVPSVGRHAGVRTLGAVGATAVALLGWQLAASGSLAPAALAASMANPAIVVVPAALAFLVALGFLTILPPLLRRLARRLRHAPLAVRLSILSVSREPERPAATVTLLAFSLGAIVFAAGWSASLAQGIDDQAAYRSGLDLRVTELGTAVSISQSVVPVERYAGLGSDVRAVPVFRGSAHVPPGGQVSVLGLEPSALPDLPGWRDDFSPTPISELARQLHVPAPAGGWIQAGHPLPDGMTDLGLDFDYAGDPLKLTAVVATDGGDHASIPLGTVREGMTKVRAPLPPAAVGGTLIALTFAHDRLIYGPHQHPLRRATVTFHGLDGLVEPEPVELEVFTVGVDTVRARQATDGVVLPVIASPDLAAAVDPDGLLRLEVGGGPTIPVRVVGVADRFPTVVDAQPRFVVVALDPWLMALNAEAPAAGRPTEMWLGTADPARAAEVRAALGAAAFRFPVVTDRAALAAERSADPLSRSIVWALLVAALAGLALSVLGILLGAVTDLRDELGELADLEAQGVGPSTLRSHVVARTAWLAGGGALAGIVVGIVLTVSVTAALAVSAEGALPIPTLRVVLPIVPLVTAVAAVLVLVLGAVAWLARGRYRDPGPRRGGTARRKTAALAAAAPTTPGAPDG